MSTLNATAATVARPLRKDAARNRQALIAAGREVFADRGLDASLDDVARHAGVGVGTAYRHFANKLELAHAIFAAAIDRIVDLAQDAATVDDPWQGLVQFLEGTAEAQTADRGLREVMMGTHDPAETERINLRLRGPVNDLVERAKGAGALRADADASDIGVVVLMLCTVADVTGDHCVDLWRRYLPMLLDGLRPGPELPVPPLDQDALLEAMSTHKQRVIRAHS